MTRPPRTDSIAAGGAFTIGALGITLTFTDGIFTAGDVYQVTCTVDAVSAAQTAQANIQRDIGTLDKDRDALYALERQQSGSADGDTTLSSFDTSLGTAAPKGDNQLNTSSQGPSRQHAIR